MQKDLRLHLIQSNLTWEDPGANRAQLEEKIWPLRGKSDIIILPEMFTTGFSMNGSGLFETMNLHTHKWMRQMAFHTGAAIAGSIIIREGNQYYNRLIWVDANGHEAWYDKIHLFHVSGEDRIYTKGDQSVIIQWKGWRIQPLICFDLRFPVTSLNTTPEGELRYDLLLYVANWPAARISAWDSLLKSRAIENYAYCAGVNRVGIDGNGVMYNGHSGCYSPKGEPIVTPTENEDIFEAVLSAKELNTYREEFPAFRQISS